jgi:hypothetical protein
MTKELEDREILKDSYNFKQEDIGRHKLFEGIEKSCEI